MACIHLKCKLNNSVYCKLHNRPVDILECFGCPDIEYRKSGIKPIKKVSKRLIQKQKARWSILYPDLTKCAVCGAVNGVELNEVYEGAKRKASMTFGFVIPMCRKHHEQFHNDREFALKFKCAFQKEFEKTHSRDEFLNIIYKSYL